MTPNGYNQQNPKCEKVYKASDFNNGSREGTLRINQMLGLSFFLN